MNHELGQAVGAVREHGSTGAFVSKLTIDMTTHQVLDAKDLSEDVFLFNRTTNAYEETTTQFGRLCSADLPAVSAFYDAATGLGTTERIFMDGEEIGNEGRAFAHIVTGAEAGDSYELPALGRMSFENSLANAYSGAKTVVMCDDDSTPGEVYVYIGDKQATGNAVEKAGLTNGELFGISASFGDDTGPGALNGTFQLIAQGNAGDVTHTTGTEFAGAERAAHPIWPSGGWSLGSEQSRPLLFYHDRHARSAHAPLGNGLLRHRAPGAGRHDQGSGRGSIFQLGSE